MLCDHHKRSLSGPTPLRELGVEPDPPFIALDDLETASKRFSA